MQHQQGRRIRPLQILDRHHDRVPGAQLLNESDDRLNHLELGGRTLAKPARVVMAGGFFVEQPRDVCPAGVRARVVEGQAVGDHPERAPTFQLLRGTVKDLNPQIDPVVEPLDNNAGLPDSGLAGHQ